MEALLAALIALENNNAQLQSAALSAEASLKAGAAAEELVPLTNRVNAVAQSLKSAADALNQALPPT